MLQTAAIRKMETSIRHIMIGWGERERDREREIERDREREVVSTTEESKVGESG